MNSHPMLGADVQHVVVGHAWTTVQCHHWTMFARFQVAIEFIPGLIRFVAYFEWDFPL